MLILREMDIDIPMVWWIITKNTIFSEIITQTLFSKYRLPLWANIGGLYEFVIISEYKKVVYLSLKVYDLLT